MYIILIFEFIYCRMYRIVIYFFLFSAFTAKAQSYIGFDADNFNGIHGALFNPANIADSRTKIDINLISGSLFTVNNYVEVDFWKLLTDSDEFNSTIDTETVGSDRKNNGVLNTDILGPSALITLNKKRAIGLTTRLRGLANINTLDGEIVEFFDTGLSEQTPIQIADINATAINNNFAEIGLTYAQVFKRDRVEFLKGGVTLKYLRGLSSASAELTDGVAFFNPNDPDNVFTRGNGQYSLSDNIDDGNNDQVNPDDDETFAENATGFGIDLGFVYEYRPRPRANVSRDNVKEQQIIRHITTYKYKIGVSILDLGFINYRNQQLTNYSVSPLNRQDILDISSLDDFEELVTTTTSTEDFKFSLPTRLRAEFDLKLNNKFFLNSVANFSLIGKNASTANRYANQITISPRYESKWFSAYLPVTATQYGGVQVGLGGRLGPVVIGASGFFSRTFDNRTRAFDVYAGLKIPIYHKTPERKNLPEDDNSVKRFNCVEGATPKGSEKVKRFKSYKGEFDGQ